MGKKNDKLEGCWYRLPERICSEEEAAFFSFFRGRITLSTVPEQYQLRLSADSRYKLYVNGGFVEMGPSRGNGQVWYYDTVDITSSLVPGENIIAVIVLRYPYRHWAGNCGIYRTETPGLYVDVRVCAGGIGNHDTDNGFQPIEWRCRTYSGISLIRENPYFSPLWIYEQARGMEEFAGWMEAGYDDSDWYAAGKYREEELPAVLKPSRLIPRTIPFLYRKKRTFAGSCGKTEQKERWNRFFQRGEAVIIPANTKEIVEINAGELVTGYLRLRMEGGRGARLSLLQSECYAGEIEKSNDPYRSTPKKGNRTDDSLELYGYTDTYEAAGFGTKDRAEVYEPFWFRTFRYIRLTIETGKEEIILQRFDYEETGYPLYVQSHVETSDQTLADVWDICERSLRRCMHETYEDCPFYEQLQYAMDTRSQILYTYAVSADDRLAVKCMDDFTHSVRPDGMINCSFPNFETNVIPGFSVYYIGMVYDYMMYFGKKEQMEHYLETIEAVLGFFQNHLDERGIVGKTGDLNKNGNYWSFIDWAPGWAETDGVPPCTLTGPITMESLLYVLGLQYGADIFEYMGQHKKAAAYRIRAKSVQRAINRFCVGANGMYQDGPGVESYSQHSQVFAVLTGTVSKETGRILLEETLKHPEKYEQCTIAMMFYLFRALEQCDLYRYTDSLWNIWREMVENQLSTCAEKPVMSRSDCHAWGALALYELPSVILGVRPAKPGYGEVEVSPRTENLQWAKGEVVTPRGKVFVSWDKTEEGEVRVQIEKVFAQRRTE